MKYITALCLLSCLLMAGFSAPATAQTATRDFGVSDSQAGEPAGSQNVLHKKRRYKEQKTERYKTRKTERQMPAKTSRSRQR